MPKITFIGAGSLVFTRNLCNDILLTPALVGSTLSLMDIDAERLDGAKQIVEALAEHHAGAKATVEATTDRRAALSGADYVVTTFLSRAGSRLTRLTSRYRNVTASSSALETPSAPAGCSALCVRSRCCSISAAS